MALLRRYQSLFGTRGLVAEVSYLEGERVEYGTSGSARLDVMDVRTREVWDYTIGGYQVIKKWLSYREKGLLGRSLTSDEVHEVMNMARRITAIVFMEPALDQNYKKVKASTYKWGSEPAK